jgi:hypothetical protein
MITNYEAAQFLGGFFFFERGIFETEVFNTFVEKTVEKGRASLVNRLASDASTQCTEARAGTFVVEL